MHSLGVFAACLVLWMMLTGFQFDRLWRTGPWELLSMAFACAGIQLSLTAARRFMTPDPRIGVVIFWAGLACATALLLSQLAMASTPEWKFAYQNKKIHALNGAVLASVLSFVVYIVWVNLTDMRLSALEPAREARMRSMVENCADEEVVGCGPWRTRYLRALKATSNALQWRQPVTAKALLMDVFTWPRVLACTVVDGVVFAFLVGVVSSLAIALGFFGEPRVAGDQLFAIEKALPSWFKEFGYIALISSGTWVMALATRWSKWLNHSVSAATTVVWVMHLGAAGACVALLGEVPQMAWLHPAVFITAIFAAMRPASLLNSRAEAIAAAQRVEHNEQAVRAQGQRSLALADLKALQAQIEPHFLYNTLANLQLLIRADASRADAMTGHLIDYLRARLPLMRAPLAALSSEVDMVRSYLEILKIRMGERLHASFDVPSDCAEVQIPTLVVMTLIENAIKHGLEPKRGGGSIAVSARRAGDWVSIRVADSGVGFGGGAGAAQSAGTGVGLANITERLRLSYPDARDPSGQGARVELLHNEPQGVIAVLHLPV